MNSLAVPILWHKLFPNVCVCVCIYLQLASMEVKIILHSSKMVGNLVMGSNFRFSVSKKSNRTN